MAAIGVVVLPLNFVVPHSGTNDEFIHVENYIPFPKLGIRKREIFREKTVSSPRQHCFWGYLKNAKNLDCFFWVFIFEIGRKCLQKSSVIRNNVLTQGFDDYIWTIHTAVLDWVED